MEIWHLTLSSASRLTLFPTARHRLAAAIAIARVLGARVLKFTVGDDHVHVEIVCFAHELPTRRSALMRALSHIAEVPLATSHVQPVRSRAHLKRNVRYFLTQSAHHGLDYDAALDPGTCFQDLVGARCLPGFDPRTLKRALPRLTRADLLSAVSLEPASLEPATPDVLRRAGVTEIVRASAGAAAAVEPLNGRAAPTVLARRIAAHLCDEAGLSRRDLAAELRTSSAAVRRLAHEPVAPSLLRAARIRVTLSLSRRALRAAS